MLQKRKLRDKKEGSQALELKSNLEKGALSQKKRFAQRT